VEASVRETFLSGRHRSGLEVRINPKRGFTRKLAVLGTRFGSVDNRYRCGGGSFDLPDGLAHFLEHQLFTKEGGDVFERFARSGASANAGTGFTQTSYYFSCTRSFRSNLDLLLKFVFTPYFSEANVRKEQGIIGQEILMYQDSPDWRIFMNLLEALYVRHPIRVDIAGTVESIAAITPEILTQAYRAFYHPSNMVLVVVGDLDPDEVVDRVERCLAARRIPRAPRIERLVTREGRGVHRRRISQALAVSQPKLLVGFKDMEPPAEGPETVRREIEGNMLLQLMFGKGTDAYQSLYAEGLIDDSFGASYTADRGFGFSAMGGDTDHPDRLEEAIRRVIRTARRRGIRKEDFHRIRRKLLGKFFFGVNSPESTAMTILSFWMKGCNPADYPATVRSIRLEHLEAHLGRLFDARNSAVSTILPDRRRR